ncbi:MAG: 2,3-bisphosphoglycerate-independent phosphoglycerate mutase [Syntrophomonadaceae bacterium]|nr:2,3-bisphosphoglycerate-independent phosphoglycerate mutase [Syntrophomonadaceae bacterium]
MPKKPVVLMILDGWGCRDACSDNAITRANPVHFKKLEANYPHTMLKCSGLDVGLPQGLMGNSEVGHLNIGAGRIVYQELTRISKAIEDRTFFDNPNLLEAIDVARDEGRSVHLMGLISDGGVHSHIKHLFALLDLCRERQMKQVFIHGFLDGRDVNPKSAADYATIVSQYMEKIGIGQFASIGGRFYGMDRDKHWDRIEKAYNSMVSGIGDKAANVFAAIENNYELRIFDEFIEPTVITGQDGKPLGLIEDGDSIIFFNFRADRARQISRAFTDINFDCFTAVKRPRVNFVCMTQYDLTIEAPVAFKPQNLENTLGEYISGLGLKQLRIAETEKYAHVTFFFNGGVEEPNPGEDRILIPSPNVETYNLKPEMSAPELTERVIQEIDRDYYEVIILNYANADMVGHTGILDAAIQAVKTVDHMMAQVVEAVLAKDGAVLITADHGNCEMMVCPTTGSPFTAHTSDLVPFILVDDENKDKTLRDDCALKDIAPTMLNLLGLPIPDEMTGRSIMIS